MSANLENLAEQDPIRICHLYITYICHISYTCVIYINIYIYIIYMSYIYIYIYMIYIDITYIFHICHIYVI